jgi:hypothetical protein
MTPDDREAIRLSDRDDTRGLAVIL